MPKWRACSCLPEPPSLGGETVTSTFNIKQCGLYGDNHTHRVRWGMRTRGLTSYTRVLGRRNRRLTAAFLVEVASGLDSEARFGVRLVF